MEISDYKFIDIKGLNIAYTERGSGRTILFVHGFASFSYTWQEMIGYLPEGMRCICIDLKGAGYSTVECDDNLAPFDQAILLSEFIRRLDLRDFVLAGHSLGGVISLISLFSENICERVSALILIAGAGLLQKLPQFIQDLTATAPNSPLVRFAREDMLAAMLLDQAYFDKNRITPEVINEYAAVLRRDKAKECLIRAAGQIDTANLRGFSENVRKIQLPSLVIWGTDDEIIPVSEAENLLADLSRAELKMIPECGHAPQEEKPAETATEITRFLQKLGIITSDIQNIPPVPARVTPLPADTEREKTYRLKMSRLIDRWSIGTLLIIIFVKILQFLKRLGFSAEENGWRKATGIFLRTEHSKFILTSFRLRYLPENSGKVDFAGAKAVLVERLADFLRHNPSCHWTLEWGFMRVWPKKHFFTDITEADFNHDGELIRLTPHLDSARKTFSLLRPEDIDMTLAMTMRLFNETRNTSEKIRAWTLEKKLRRKIRKLRGLSRGGKTEVRELTERILNGTFIQFETLTADPEKLTRSRLATPNMKNRRHPGSGLLNIVCRFTNDLSEADLWFQHHHVPVDGMPMQEMLESLKTQWGSAGQILYPAINTKTAAPEVFYFGHRLFRARIYVDFERFNRLRRHLNDNYYAEMGGSATVSSMLIWGLAQHGYFRDSKFLFPVDTSLIMDCPQERNISLIFIRPSKFFAQSKPLDGFIRYQREFNHRLSATRIGKSESYELLELYAMIHPVFYYIARYLMPKAMSEFLGTTGLTILKDAEMFISPLSDLQSKGFVALGNLMMPTEDGRTAGAVSICGSKKQVRAFIDAFNSMTEQYPDYLGIRLPE